MLLGGLRQDSGPCPAKSRWEASLTLTWGWVGAEEGVARFKVQLKDEV